MRNVCSSCLYKTLVLVVIASLLTRHAGRGMTKCSNRRFALQKGSSLFCKYVASRHSMDAPGTVVHWQPVDGSIAD
eukprot:jgi/Chrzof1/9872/Cz04g19060.t1